MGLIFSPRKRLVIKKTAIYTAGGSDFNDFNKLGGEDFSYCGLELPIKLDGKRRTQCGLVPSSCNRRVLTWQPNSHHDPPILRSAQPITERNHAQPPAKTLAHLPPTPPSSFLLLPSSALPSLLPSAAAAAASNREEEKMVKKSKKSKSKRVTLRQKHKVLRKVKEHHRKKRKEAKKEGKNHRKKVEKDPGIPNEWPFKEQELKALEARRAQALQELELKKEARKERVSRAPPFSLFVFLSILAAAKVVLPGSISLVSFRLAILVVE